jgi:molybdate transport system substrate-binding protein
MKLRIRHGVITVWITLSTATSRLGGARTAGMAELLVLALATPLSGCARQPTRSVPSGHLPASSIMVFAARPLKPAFTLLAGKYRADKPGATVEFDFATSAELANKLTRGASADVYASADTAEMDTRGSTPRTRPASTVPEPTVATIVTRPNALSLANCHLGCRPER